MNEWDLGFGRDSRDCSRIYCGKWRGNEISVDLIQQNDFEAGWGFLGVGTKNVKFWSFGKKTYDF